MSLHSSIAKVNSYVLWSYLPLWSYLSAVKTLCLHNFPLELRKLTNLLSHKLGCYGFETRFLYLRIVLHWGFDPGGFKIFCFLFADKPMVHLFSTRQFINRFLLLVNMRTSSILNWIRAFFFLLNGLEVPC